MIWVDSRVGSAHLLKAITGLDVHAALTTLEFGDVMFEGNGPGGRLKIGVELKGGTAGSDFLSSMQSNRLVGHQIPGVTKAYDRSYLIIEGLKVTKKGLIWQVRRRYGKQARPIFAADVARYVVGLEELGIRVRYTKGPAETAVLIVKELYAFWQKPYDQHTSIHAMYRPAVAAALRKDDPVTDRMRRVAMDLADGIGWGRSKKVAEHFESIDDMISNVADWADVEGIGSKLAGGVVRNIVEKKPTRSVSKSHQAR